VVTERGGEEEGQGEDESCKLCVEEDDGSHGCCMLLMLSLELGLISLRSLLRTWIAREGKIAELEEFGGRTRQEQQELEE